MDPGTFLQTWADDPDRDGELVHLRRHSSRAPIYRDLDVAPVVSTRLAQRGIDRLYRHQVEAIELIRSGHHVVLAAGTAAGKSLCFQIPIIETALEDPKRHVLADLSDQGSCPGSGRIAESIQLA